MNSFGPEGRAGSPVRPVAPAMRAGNVMKLWTAPRPDSSRASIFARLPRSSPRQTSPCVPASPDRGPHRRRSLTKVAVDLGTTGNGDPAEMDLEELLSTRLLVQGNSGSGKSHLFRRILEQSAGW